ncbi:hypothetical protein Pryu01_02236 [Paraliobacillus ryukyuensis]|uniref:Uncharacterized protein n=1 Tax=Paraliobacillus ryukyuensis TaxID=200904 RepID=A0A366E6L2_9BACI|nr:hypothetical protein [Paraliobacillus ryukyuensis]RBO98016.1 hypothetical protein DES48_10636 [Paraliobacillus ryukyuensis]
MINKELDVFELQRKMQQQEQTIAQLVSIIATTNQRLKALEQKQNGLEQNLSSCSSPSRFA